MAFVKLIIGTLPSDWSLQSYMNGGTVGEVAQVWPYIDWGVGGPTSLHEPSVDLGSLEPLTSASITALNFKALKMWLRLRFIPWGTGAGGGDAHFSIPSKLSSQLCVFGHLLGLSIESV